jgi:hypothetical protein
MRYAVATTVEQARLTKCRSPDLRSSVSSAGQKIGGQCPPLLPCKTNSVPHTAPKRGALSLERLRWARCCKSTEFCRENSNFPTNAERPVFPPRIRHQGSCIENPALRAKRKRVSAVVGMETRWKKRWDPNAFANGLQQFTKTRTRLASKPLLPKRQTLGRWECDLH